MSLETLSAVWDLDLSRNKKAVLECLAWHANADNKCWPSKSRIMYRTNLSESTVKRTLAELKSDGLLSVIAHAQGGRGKAPIYELHPEKGFKKPPFNEWLKGFKMTQKGVRALTPQPTIEPSDKNTVVTSLHSVTTEGPPSSSENKEKLKNPVAILIEKWQAKADSLNGTRKHFPYPDEAHKRSFAHTYKAERKKGTEEQILIWATDHNLAYAAGEINPNSRNWIKFNTSLCAVVEDGWRPTGGSALSKEEMERIERVAQENAEILRKALSG